MKMDITVNNIDRNLRVELSQLCEIVNVDENPKGVFLQWVTPDVDDLFKKQTLIVDYCINNQISMIIFDKNDKISPEEAGYLISVGAFLWEPSVTGRNFFSFQPNWGRLYTDYNDIPMVYPETRSIHLANYSSLVRKFSSYHNYYVPAHETGEFNVKYLNVDDNQTIYSKIENLGIPITNNADNNIKTTILLGSDRDYETGYLDPNLFKILENGIVPMLPKEHRWYHSIFSGLVVSSEDDIEYVLKTVDKIAFGCIYDVYRNLGRHLPECNVKNVAKRIVNFFE